jgi:hypothetical protein
MQPDTELQAKQDVSQVHDEGCWLRDEEAAGSNPATPTLKPQVTHHKAACGSFSPLPMSDFGSERKPILRLTSLTRYSGPAT